MRKIYLNLSKSIIASAIVGGYAIMPTSCVNDTYSIDKEINMDMNIGDTFIIPLGYSSPIVLGEELDEETIEGLKLDGDGNYAIRVDDNIDVDLSAISDIEVEIDPIEQDLSIDPVALDIPSLEPFEIAEDSYSFHCKPADIVITNPEQDINKEFIFGSEIPTTITGVPAGITLNDVAINILADQENLRETLDIEFDIPTDVEEVSNITFNNNATVTLDASSLKTYFKDGFNISLATISVTLPEGFCVDNTNSNTVTRTNLTADAEGKISFDLTIDKYTKTIGSGSASINGDIIIDIAPTLIVSGTTSGITPSSNDMTISIEGAIKANDFDLKLATINIPLGGGANKDEEIALGDKIEINDIDEMITGITSITLAEDGNQININISPITGLPQGLKATDNNITVQFPASRFAFDMSANSAAGINMSGPTATNNYELKIPASDIIGGNGYNKNLTVTKIMFLESDLKNQTLAFDPAVMMLPTSLGITGEISLSEYQDFAAQTRSITASISAEKANGQQIKIESAALTTAGYTAKMETQSNSIDESIKIDPVIKNIYTLEFAEAVYLNIDIDVDIAGTDADLAFKNYTVEFPLFIKFDDSVGATLNAAGDKYQLTLNDKFTKSGDTRSFHAKFKVDKLDFTDESYKDIITSIDDETNELSISGDVNVSGALYLAGGNVDSGNLPQTITPEISYSLKSEASDGKISIGKVTGIVSTEITDEDSGMEPIDLSDFVDQIEGGDLSLVLANPSLLLTAKNTLGIPVEITSFTLSPSRDGKPTQRSDANGNKSDIVLELEEPIRINPSTDGEVVTTTIRITNDGEEGSDPNINYVAMKDLKYILAELPDQIEISYEAGIVTDQTHVIDLNEDYTFFLDYQLDIPLDFEAFDLEYSTTIDGFSGNLDEVFKYVTTVDFEVEATSDMPFNVEIVEIVPLDIDGEPITGLDPFIEEGKSMIKANGTSELQLEVSDNENNDLSRLDGIEICMKAYIDSSIGGKLSKDQSIKLKFTAGIKGGINISGDDL